MSAVYLYRCLHSSFSSSSRGRRILSTDVQE